MGKFPSFSTKWGKRMRRKDNVRRFLLSAALAALSLSACASAPPQVETITIDGEDLIMDISEEKAFSFDCQPADAQREELALKAPAQLGAELEDERIIIDPDAEGTFTLYLQSDAVTSNAITVTVIDSARIEAEKQAEEEARRRRQKAQETRSGRASRGGTAGPTRAGRIAAHACIRRQCADAWTALKDALAAAETIMTDEGATQEQVDQAASCPAVPRWMPCRSRQAHPRSECPAGHGR